MQNINKFLYLALSIGIVASSSLYACDKYSNKCPINNEQYNNKYNAEEIYTGNNNVNDDEYIFGDDNFLLNNNVENNNNSLPKNIDKINDGKKTKVNENVNTLQEFITKSSTGTVHNPFIELSNKKLNNPFIDLQNTKTSPIKQKFNNNISPNKFNSINNFNPNKNNINISNDLTLKRQFANINNINKVKNTNNIIRLQNPYNNTNTPTFLNNNKNNQKETVSTVLEKMQRHINRESTKFNENKNNINKQLKRIKDYQDAATTMLNDWNKEIIEIAKKLGTTESSQNQNDIAIKNLVERMNHEKFDDDVENELLLEQVSNAKLLKNNRRISKNISENNNTNLYVKYSYNMEKISNLINNSPNIDINDKKKIINTNNMLNGLCYNEFENIKDDLDTKLQNISTKQTDIHYRIINLNRLMNNINNDTNNTLKTTADHNESVRYLQSNMKKILNANAIKNTILLTPEFNINANYNGNDNNIDSLPNITNVDNNNDTIEIIKEDIINCLATNASTKNVLIKLNKKLNHFNRVNNDFFETCNALNTWGNSIENNTNNNLTLLNNNKNKIINKLNNATEFNKKHSLSIKKIQISMCDAEHYKKINDTISYKFQKEKDKNRELNRTNRELENSVNVLKVKCKRLRKANNTERNRDRSSDSNINNRERSKDREISEEKRNTNLANNNLRNISSNNEEMNIEETNNNQINIEINNKEIDTTRINNNTGTNNNYHTNNNNIRLSNNDHADNNNIEISDNEQSNNNIGTNNNQRSSFVRTEIPANSNRYTINYPKFGPKPEQVILDSDDE